MIIIFMQKKKKICMELYWSTNFYNQNLFDLCPTFAAKRRVLSQMDRSIYCATTLQKQDGIDDPGKRSCKVKHRTLPHHPCMEDRSNMRKHKGKRATYLLLNI